MRVLGLDLSLTAPGMALVQPPEPPQGHLVKVPEGLRGVERLTFIGRTVHSAVVNLRPDIVAIEGYSFNSRAASQAHAIGELGGVVRYLLHGAGFEYVEVPPATWRKQLLGRGNLPKTEVSKEAWKRYGIEFDSLDVLEAWCVATAVYRTRLGLDKPAAVTRRRRQESDGEFAERARRAAS